MQCSDVIEVSVASVACLSLFALSCESDDSGQVSSSGAADHRARTNSGSSEPDCEVPPEFQMVDGACRVEREGGDTDTGDRKTAVLDRDGRPIRVLVDEDDDGTADRIELHVYDSSGRRTRTEYYIGKDHKHSQKTIRDAFGPADAGSSSSDAPEARLETELLDGTSLELGVVEVVQWSERGVKTRRTWDGRLYTWKGERLPDICEDCPSWNAWGQTGEHVPDGEPDRTVTYGYDKAGNPKRKSIDDDADGEADFVRLRHFVDGRIVRKSVDGTLDIHREAETVRYENEDGETEEVVGPKRGGPEIERREADGEFERVIHYEFEDGERSVERVEESSEGSSGDAQ